MKCVLRLQCTLRNTLKFCQSDRHCLAVILAPFSDMALVTENAARLLWCVFQLGMCATHQYQRGVNCTSVSASIDALFLRATLTGVNSESCLETQLYSTVTPHTVHAPHCTHPTLYMLHRHTPHSVHAPHCTHPTLYMLHTYHPTLHMHPTVHAPHCTRSPLYTPHTYTPYAVYTMHCIHPHCILYSTVTALDPLSV